MKIKNKAQSILEHVVVLTAVITALVAGAKTLVDYTGSNGLAKLMVHCQGQMQNAAY